MQAPHHPPSLQEGNNCWRGGARTKAIGGARQALPGNRSVHGTVLVDCTTTSDGVVVDPVIHRYARCDHAILAFVTTNSFEDLYI